MATRDTGIRRDGRPPAEVSLDRAHADLDVDELIEHALRRGEGMLCRGGALSVTTGGDTGRSPDATRVVRPADASGPAPWAGSPIRYLDRAEFDWYWDRASAHQDSREQFTVTGVMGDAATGAGFGIRVVTENAWHALFVRHFVRPGGERLPEPVLQVRHAPGLRPETSGVPRAVLVDLESARAVITGTHYAGEIKNLGLIFAYWLFPARNLLPLHCSASVGIDQDDPEDVAMFIGYSGAGKTSLATMAGRAMLGDDAHIWSIDGLITLEVGCYASALGLTEEDSPAIYASAARPGALLQDVVVDPETGECNFSDASLTANTCAAFPAHFLRHHVASGRAAHPRNIFFLVHDAVGAYPPIARLSEADAVRLLALGYSGNRLPVELGDSSRANRLHPCFASPFIPIDPAQVVALFRARLRSTAPNIWLLNTGIALDYGVTRQIPLRTTEELVRSALAGGFAERTWQRDDQLGLWIDPEAALRRPPGVVQRVAADLRDGLLRVADIIPPDLRRWSRPPPQPAAGPDGE